MPSDSAKETGLSHRGAASHAPGAPDTHDGDPDEQHSASFEPANEGPRSRQLRHLVAARQTLRRLSIPVLGFLIASLLLPALTKQWSDRAGELDLKNNLLTAVNESTTDAVLAAECFNRFCLPELAPFRSLSNDTTIQDLDPDMWNNALISASEFQNNFTRDWQKSQAVTQGVLDTYFPGTKANVHWRQYADAVDAYIAMSTQDCVDTDSEEVNLLQEYIGTAQEGVWDDYSSCDTLLRDPAYASIGEDLLRSRERITTAVIESNAAGYSSGFTDLMRDIWPF